MLSYVGIQPSAKAHSLICAVLTYCYCVADHLDGMQARRTMENSMFGALLDHICDFFNGSLIALGVCLSIGLPSSVLVIISIFYIVTFSILHLEALVKGELWLGRLGALEGLLILIFFFASWSTLPGRSIWEASLPVLLSIPTYWLLIGLFLIGFSLTIGLAVTRFRSSIDKRYICFCWIIILFGICQICFAPVNSIAIWEVMIVYAGRYVLELLIARDGQVPVPKVFMPLFLHFCSRSLICLATCMNVSLAVLQVHCLSV
jgi:phosphatidylglycerophosphate synthase